MHVKITWIIHLHYIATLVFFFKQKMQIIGIGYKKFINMLKKTINVFDYKTNLFKKIYKKSYNYKNKVKVL